MLTLQYLFAVRGSPELVRSDNGPEFIAKELQRWLERASVRTLYIQKARPWENGYIQRGRLAKRNGDRAVACALLAAN